MHALFFFLPLLLLPSAHSVNFKLTRFDPDVNGIIYHGDAAPSAGAVELIFRNTYTCRVGWVTHAERVRIWDSNSGQLSNFTTHFSFVIDTQGRSSYGHGLAFFLASVGFEIPPNSASGFLGLYNTSTIDSSSQNQIVHVEFDSLSNPDWDPEPPVGHVGINNNSLSSAVHTPWNASFHSGDTADVWITYDATAKNLSVLWTYKKTSNPLENSSLSHTIDLMKVLPEWVTIGFSSATGSSMERNLLLSWEFNSTLDTNDSSSKRIRIIVGVAVCALSAGAIIGILISWRRRKQKVARKEGEKVNMTSINEDLETRAGPRRFSYEDLVSATNNFSNERLLGKGGFGAVYKGYLIDMDLAIAVKKISRGSRQGKKEYISEVKTIGLLRHRNLVQLLGWCHDKGEFLLIYEFMPNGSLDAHLFGKKSPLTWAARYKISLGLASALLYLHEEWEQCVVHRDVKSSNVMLDSNFNAKLGDFGLARLMDHELGPKTTGLAGTLGYLAPEYISTRKASKESDVYSFGVVALEIGSGRRAIDHIEEENEMSLVEWIWELYGRKKLHVAIDKGRFMDYEEKQMECLMIVGLWCAHPDHSLRPSIRQAIQVLNFEAPIPNLPPKMPVPMYRVQVAHVNSVEPSITNSSIGLGR
ncbi:hypothetical protein P3X46_018568 [Hevea brasiliensis]|uniref:Protein kinase domain-containing protein n=2 Tax=Hevea brasiliensis TaxID=3981 RepID=A0ABQ9LR34_HEVBR|nr:hypothetical protein P3X46_018568 [Hevea brasiliensis]